MGIALTGFVKLGLCFRCARWVRELCQERGRLVCALLHRRSDAACSCASSESIVCSCKQCML